MLGSPLNLITLLHQCLLFLFELWITGDWSCHCLDDHDCHSFPQILNAGTTNRASIAVQLCHLVLHFLALHKSINDPCKSDQCQEMCSFRRFSLFLLRKSAISLMKRNRIATKTVPCRRFSTSLCMIYVEHQMLIRPLPSFNFAKKISPAKKRCQSGVQWSHSF